MSGLSKHAPESQLNPSAEIKADKLHKEESTRNKKNTEQLLKGFIGRVGVFVFVDVLVSGCTSVFVSVCVIFLLGGERRTKQEIKFRMMN